MISPAMQEQPNNPLHGVTLAAMLDFLLEELGWEGLANEVDVRCFQIDPSVTSSLKFLRKVPWARARVEQLYLHIKRSEQ
ncbi:MAG TPA: VF530 family protein [Planctomycetota bacterium]|nr:VF530 family protein [Planctomycetota bacterium]